GLRDHPAAPVEEGGRAVTALFDVGGERRPDEHRAHLLGDGAQRAAENLELNIHDRVSLQPAPFPSLTPTHPWGSQQVAVSSWSRSGPVTSVRGVVPRSIFGPARTSAVRTATSSIGREGSA